MEKIYTLFYSIGQGMKNIKRNRMFSITSIITITASLFLFGIFYFLTSNVQYMVHNMEKSVSVSVFFEDTISEEQIQQIGAALKRRTDVKKVEYIFAQEYSLDEIKSKLAVLCYDKKVSYIKDSKSDAEDMTVTIKDSEEVLPDFLQAVENYKNQ